MFETSDGCWITLASDLGRCRGAASRATTRPLIGGSDRHGRRGHLRVTLHHNLWQDCGERTPRASARCVANNLFVVHPARTTATRSAWASRPHRERDNAWETGPGSASRLVKPWGGTQLSDRGSLHNGRPVALGAALRRAYPQLALDEQPAFDPPPIAERCSAAEVAARVRSGAGSGSAYLKW